MKTLNVSKDSFDQENTFMVVVKGFRGTKEIKCSLKKDYEKVDDGIYWGLKKSSMLKDVYTEADRAETARLNSEAPLVHGEVVEINGELYVTRVVGDYSDAVIFDKKA